MFLSGYQMGARWQGTRMNVALVTTYLEPGANSALDVGSNEGVITCAMALAGARAKGVEINGKYVARARALAKRLGSPVQFEARAMSLADIEAHASVDVIAFLSVHHQIVVGQGLKVANDYLRALARKSVRQFFFQPACLAEKYGGKSPGFADNDLPAIIDYFTGVVGGEMPHMTVIGLSQNDMPKHEPLRPMLLFSREPPTMRRPAETVAILARIEAAVAAASPLHWFSYTVNHLFNQGRRAPVGR